MKRTFAVITMAVAPVALAQPVWDMDRKSEWRLKRAHQAEEMIQEQHMAAAEEASGPHFQSMLDSSALWESGAEPFQSQRGEKDWSGGQLNTPDEEFEYHRSRRDVDLDPRMSW